MCEQWLKFFVPSTQRLIVCLEESLYIHNIRDMKVLHTIRETPPNPSGAQISKTYFCFFIYFFVAQFFHNRMLIDFTVLLSQQHWQKTNFDTNILGTETRWVSVICMRMLRPMVHTGSSDGWLIIRRFLALILFLGLCALSISNDNCYLAYPGSATIGEVQVFDTVNLVGFNLSYLSKKLIWLQHAGQIKR